MRKAFHYALFLVLAAALTLPLYAQQRAKRLILKDGSYQLATKWEIKGERVRYYSAERYGWEELPKSLIDWPATEKWEKENPAGTLSRETQEVTAEEEAERRAEEAKTPEVAPGLRLPRDGGVLLLDQVQDGPVLVAMAQNGGEINAERGKNILRAALNPFASVKQKVELKGARARVQAHATQPVFYLNVSDDPDAAAPAGAASTKNGDLDARPGRFRIVRATKNKDARVVGNLKIALTGKVTQQGNWIEVRSEPVSGGWLRLTPAAPLASGEYAIVEMLGPKEMNLYVWDFGVDPAAPVNASAWKPVAVEKNETGTKETPVLNKRPD